MPEVRRLLQVMGTEVGRQMFGEDFWIDLMFSKIEGDEYFGLPVALTGIRYQNELDRVKAAGGYTVWVNRPNHGPVNAHSSDNSLTCGYFDYVLDNVGSLKDLEYEVYLMLEALT